jgi:hypothetical protein
MNRPFTVYFDTSFYVRLCRAEQTEAFGAVDELNSLTVRHVISDVLIRELLTSRSRTHLDELLVSRLQRFSLSPYPTSDGLSWQVLLSTGDQRIVFADVFRNVHDEMARATSYSILARRDLNAAQEITLKEQVAQFGFPKNFEDNKSQVLSAARNMLESFGMTGLDWPETPTPENLWRLHEQLMSMLGESVITDLREQHRIEDSITRSEDRPFQVATGAASKKSKKGLSNTLRDSEHMMAFIKNRSEIDVLQVDTAQERLIRRITPMHRIAELGLADRCFAADSLQAVVDKVRILRERNCTER